MAAAAVSFSFFLKSRHDGFFFLIPLQGIVDASSSLSPPDGSDLIGRRFGLSLPGSQGMTTSLNCFFLFFPRFVFSPLSSLEPPTNYAFQSPFRGYNPQSSTCGITSLI